MSTIKNPTRFAELEYCLQGYFDGKLAPVMKQVRDELTHKQLEESKQANGTAKPRRTI